MKLLLFCVLAACVYATAPIHQDHFPFEYNNLNPIESLLVCKPTKCVGAGHQCGVTEKAAYGCESGTYASIEGRDHPMCICRPIPWLVPNGLPCNGTGIYECGLELSCQYDFEGVKRCLGNRGHGDKCQTSQDCKPGHECREGFCATYLEVGARCDVRTPLDTDTCPPDSICAPLLGTKFCIPRGKLGDNCTSTIGCQQGMACNEYSRKCEAFFSLAIGQATSSANLCETGHSAWGMCAPVPGGWHDVEHQECQSGECGDAGTCVCTSWEKTVNRGICIAKSSYGHEEHDAMNAVFAKLRGRCYPNLSRPGMILTQIPEWDCAMRLAGKELMSKAFCWYLHNLQSLNGNGATPNCDSNFSVWLAGFCGLSK